MLKKSAFVFRENFQNSKHFSKLKKMKEQLNISSLSTTSEPPLAHSSLRKALNPNNTNYSFRNKSSLPHTPIAPPR